MFGVLETMPRSIRSTEREKKKNFRLWLVLVLLACVVLSVATCFIFRVHIKKVLEQEIVRAWLAFALVLVFYLLLGLIAILLVLRHFNKERLLKEEQALSPKPIIKRVVSAKKASISDVAELDSMIQSGLAQFDSQLESQKQFIADAIHELNTPTALLRLSIDSYRKRLQDGDAKIFDYVFMDTLNHATQRIENLVEQIDKLDAKPIAEANTYINVAELIQQVDDLVAKIAAQKEITLEEDIQGSQTLFSNRSFVQSILLNLLDNAVKYSRSGSTVSVFADCNEAGCQFVVKDQGIGISEKDLPHITQRFYRVSQSRSRKVGGSGLGLAITDEMVRKLGGRLHIESELNVGTTVSFYIPSQSDESEVQI